MYESYMDPPRPQRPRSLYAALATFPAACFILTFLTDLAYWASASYLWETISAWLLTAGLVAAGITVLAGVIDLVRSRTIRGLDTPWPVAIGHLVAFGLSLVNVFVHSRDGYTAVIPQGLLLSTFVVLVLLFTTLVARSMASRSRVGGLA